MSSVNSTRPTGAFLVIMGVFAFNDLAAFPAADSVVNDFCHCFLRSDTGLIIFPVYYTIFWLFFQFYYSSGSGLLMARAFFTLLPIGSVGFWYDKKADSNKYCQLLHKRLLIVGERVVLRMFFV